MNDTKQYWLTDGIKVYYSKRMDLSDFEVEQMIAEDSPEGKIWWTDQEPDLPKSKIFRDIHELVETDY